MIQRFVIFCFLLPVAILACTAPEQTARKTDKKGEERAEKQEEQGERFDLDNYRNSLRDTYATKRHEVPEEFLTYRKKEDIVRGDIRDGFRIQILSSRRVSLADSAAQKFDAWVDTLDIDYKPESYIIFKQPYYRVHVGDFSRRETAISYSRWIKQEFPGAWVVHDRINPQNTPQAQAAKARKDSLQTDTLISRDTAASKESRKP